jgi:hypothetical protein
LKKLLLFLLPLALPFFGQSQTLQPSIGIGPLPNDSDAICPIPWYLGDYASSGLQSGDTAYDFTLYDLNGNPFHLDSVLALGKPVLLVAGNYTCPVFRDKIPMINYVYNSYGSQITTVVIYGVEAHPTDTSPYFGYVNLTQYNINDGIYFPQPTTYGERKLMAVETYVNTTLQAPVYIDGPCNNWWLNYGPAPNNAYLIDTNGIVFAKHDWYDNYPHDIICDIDSLLGIPANCSSGPGNGYFTATMLTGDTVWGVAGNVITVDMEFVNSSSDDVVLGIKRMQNNTAPGWSTSLCATICYSPITDSIQVQMFPGDTLLFHVNFFTDTVPGMSMVRIGFRNMASTLNPVLKDFYCYTSLTTGIPSNESAPDVKIYPNPAGDVIHASAGFKIASIEVLDFTGRILFETENSDLDVSGLSPGIYFVRVTGANGETSIEEFVKL